MKIEFDDNYFMSKAIDEAKIALSKGEVPVGAVIVADNKIIARLPKGWIDRRGSDLVKKKKIISIIENNFIKFGFTGLETPFAEISENIGSFLAEDQNNPMSDVYSFKDGNDFSKN